MANRKKQADPNQTDALGLGKDVEIAKLIPSVQSADLSVPVVAKYLGYEVKHSRAFNRDQRLYQFQLPSQFNGARFTLWAQTQLDLKMASIPRGSIVVLEYGGRPEGDRAQHIWSVRPFRGNTVQLAELVARYTEGCEIVTQAVAMLDNSMNGTANTDEDNDNLPF